MRLTQFMKCKQMVLVDESVMVTFHRKYTQNMSCSVNPGNILLRVVTHISSYMSF